MYVNVIYHSWGRSAPIKSYHRCWASCSTWQDGQTDGNQTTPPCLHPEDGNSPPEGRRMNAPLEYTCWLKKKHSRRIRDSNNHHSKHLNSWNAESCNGSQLVRFGLHHRFELKMTFNEITDKPLGHLFYFSPFTVAVVKTCRQTVTTWVSFDFGRGR